MDKNLQTLTTFQRLSQRVIPMLVLYSLVPLLVFAGFGVYAIFVEGWWLWLVGALLISTLIFVSLLLVTRPKPIQTKQLDAKTITQDKQPAYWTDFDRQQYDQLLPQAQALLTENADWNSLHNHGLTIMQLTASAYSDKAYAQWSFSLPEFFKVMENISQRYRRVLKENVPAIEHIKISSILRGHDQLQRFKFFHTAYKVYRKLRIITPTGLLAEARSMMFDQAFDGVSNEITDKIKYLLVNEALRVAIDLYGGHFTFVDDELRLSKAGQADSKRMAPEAEPLRIGIIGQVSAGKSSLVNYFIGHFQAEVGAIPCAEQEQVYSFTTHAGEAAHLVDLPGIDHNEKLQAQNLASLKECDLILWALKANQPARELDKLMLTTLRTWFTEKKQRSRKMPPIIGVLTQVDKLVKNLPNMPTANSPEAVTIQQAVSYNQQLLKLDAIVPVALNTDDQLIFNEQQLLAVLEKNYDAALNVQLNRRRHEASEFSIKQELHTMGNLLKSACALKRHNQK
ncbi:GTPase [Pseudomonas sp. F1_0610]|uniref:GTPase n=1 Tax=Pseudomonas sp. F1_0610 TaxID=3114284 RepID=UPI0039C3EFBF